MNSAKATRKNQGERKSRTPARPASPHRTWIFRIIAMLLPLAALVGVEIVLRWSGYGHSTDFFERIHTSSGDYLVDNQSFSLRFFPPQLARWPVPLMLKTPKPAGTYRIFILGESAAMGDPEPAYGAPRYLEALLSARFTNLNFEVVNVSCTAINSHTIVPIARECARQQGDCWIIYMGNNEMVGPFGAATVFGSKQVPPNWIVRLSLGIQRTRTGQAIAALARRFKKSTEPALWGGMEMFLGSQISPDDPRKVQVYRNFQSNLADILRAGRNSGANLILNTVAVNLKDCPPLAVLATSNRPAGDLTEFNRLIAEAGQRQVQGDYAGAAQRFSDAAQLDAHRPDLHFHWAECLLQLNDRAGARQHFQLACDYDALPFRADSRINDSIRQAARQAGGDRLVLLDADALLQTNSPSGICGEEFFYEHVHLNFRGNYLLARGWAEQIVSFLPPGERGSSAAEWASPENCERRLGLAGPNRGFVIQSVLWRLQRPPLSTQENNHSRTATLEKQLMESRQEKGAESVAAVKQFHEEAIQRSPVDLVLRENYARFLESIGDLRNATAQWRSVAEAMPHNCVASYQVGRLLALQGQWAEAETRLLQAVAQRPEMPSGWFQLGNVRLGQGKLEMALENYERAEGLDPADAIYCVFTGKVLSQMNRQTEAVARFQEALKLKPDCWEAHFALGDQLVVEDKIAEAQKEYEAVVHLQPGNSMAHLNIGVALARQGRMEAAQKEFEETLRLDPANKMAAMYRDRIVPPKRE